MAIGKQPPSITKQLLSATRQQASAFSASNSQSGKTIDSEEMRAILLPFYSDPATVRAMDGGPTHFSKEAKKGLTDLLGDKKMDRGARTQFLKAVGAWPEHNPDDEIVALYAVALRRAADAVRANPNDAQAVTVARMMSTVASEILQPVAAQANTPLRGSGISGQRANRGAAVFASSTATARTAFAASTQDQDGLDASIANLVDLNKALRGQ